MRRSGPTILCISSMSAIAPMPLKEAKKLAQGKLLPCQHQRVWRSLIGWSGRRDPPYNPMSTRAHGAHASTRAQRARPLTYVLVFPILSEISDCNSLSKSLVSVAPRVLGCTPDDLRVNMLTFNKALFLMHFPLFLICFPVP